MIIADTGFFIALGNRSDQNHQLAIQILNILSKPLITAYPVVTEICYLLSTRVGNTDQCRFLRELVNNSFEIFTLQNNHIERMIELLERYANLPMDMADASLVVLAESLGHGRILTVDRRDFSIYRWNNHNVFDNLLC